MTLSSVIVLIVAGVLPYLLIRRSSIPIFAIGGLAVWLPAIAWLSLARVDRWPEGGPLLGYLFVAQLTLFLATLWVEGENEAGGTERWTPVTAAIFATLVFLSIGLINSQWPLDGDEPYYLLMAESVASDGDLDLSNQFDSLETSLTGRPDLEPQWGDVVSDGEVRSHHEPFLSLLMVPAALAGSRLIGALLIALFGGALIWSVFRWLEELGVERPGRSVGFLGFSFGAPVVYFSARIWPEVPAAFFFVQALRALSRRSPLGVALWLTPMMLLKLRFVPIGAMLIAISIWLVMRDDPERRRVFRRAIPVLILAIVVPFLVMVLAAGSGFGVHTIEEVLPQSPGAYLKGFAGMLIDAQAGLLFQAPLLFLGLLAFTRWRTLPKDLLWGCASVVPYLLLLAPRAEWHGGWAPPLRYLVVLTPLLAAGLIFVERRLSRPILFTAALCTSGLVWIAVSWPWRLFRIADGESLLGEALSRSFRSDFSSVLPSLIRPNDAVWYWSLFAVALLALAAKARSSSTGWTSVGAVVLLALFAGLGFSPKSRVEIEDAHVHKAGGELYPERWTVARFLYSGGWAMQPGDSVEFPFEGGTAVLTYRSPSGATIRVDGIDFDLPAVEGDGFMRVEARPDKLRTRMEMVSGEAVLDRVERERH